MRRFLKFFQAASILSGMIIGVGMFGIPFSFAKSGFLLGIFELAILTGLILLYHLLYSEVVLSTSSFHRMPGYVRLYLGKSFAVLEWIISLAGMPLTLLVYLILGSTFLHGILTNFFPEIPHLFSLIIFILVTVLINILPLKKEAPIGSILVFLLALFILILSGVLLPHVKFAHLTEIHWQEGFFPYGVLLFALSGGVVIPDLVTFLDRNRNIVRRAVVAGTLLPAFLYGLFAYVIVGVLGNAVDPQAIEGLQLYVGPSVVFLGNVIGLLATFTASITLAESFESLLRLDFGTSRIGAQLVINGIPLAFYIAGFQNFFIIISIIGALVIGVESALVIAMYHTLEARQGRLSPWSYIWKAAIYFLLIIGVLYQLVRF